MIEKNKMKVLKKELERVEEERTKGKKDYSLEEVEEISEKIIKEEEYNTVQNRYI